MGKIFDTELDELEFVLIFVFIYLFREKIIIISYTYIFFWDIVVFFRFQIMATSRIDKGSFEGLLSWEIAAGREKFLNIFNPSKSGLKSINVKSHIIQNKNKSFFSQRRANTLNPL